MPTTQRTDSEFHLAEPCGDCHAKPGDPCVIKAKSGSRTIEFHASRVDRGLKRIRALHLECVRAAFEAADESPDDRGAWSREYKRSADECGLGPRFRPELWSKGG